MEALTVLAWSNEQQCRQVFRIWAPLAVRYCDSAIDRRLPQGWISVAVKDGH
jgi:hypothetical protein